MREFKCYNCNHTWTLPFGQGGRGVGLSCPECGSSNVHRIGKARGQGRGGRGQGGRGQGGRGQRGRGYGGVQDLGKTDSD